MADVRECLGVYDFKTGLSGDNTLIVETHFTDPNLNWENLNPTETLVREWIKIESEEVLREKDFDGELAHPLNALLKDKNFKIEILRPDESESDTLCLVRVEIDTTQAGFDDRMRTLVGHIINEDI